MNKNLLAVVMGLFFSMLVLFCANNSLSAETENVPIIHVDKTTHTFQPVFEGEELSHTFKVLNKGRAELHIKKVTHA
jgi:hypothetical protein